jgi:predicted DNA-binding transcriptional regulator YafY
MYSPSTRLLTVLELLQSQGEVTGPELAARLEVDVRSVRRYITMLRDLGIPVESEPGRYGAYSLRPGFRLPPLMFNSTEIMAIILGLMAVRRLGMTGTLGVESATAKIERVLPDELRERVRAIQDVLTLNINANPSSVESILTPFSLAAYQHRQLWLRYCARSSSDYSERVIDVYGLVYHLSAWYAVGYCHLRGGLRNFRLDRVVEVKLLDTPFEPPADFDALDYLMDSTARMPGVWNVEVLLKTSLQEAKARVSPTVAVLEEVEGGVVLRAWADGLDWIARYLVSVGIPLTVIQPAELKAALRQLASRIMQMADS